MKAVRLHKYDERPTVEEVPDPKIEGPFDVVVRIGGAGLCRACRAGDEMHCDLGRFPGVDSDGGMAGFLKTSARACVKLNPSLQPADVAALADAGLTAYHAAKKRS